MIAFELLNFTFLAFSSFEFSLFSTTDVFFVFSSLQVSSDTSGILDELVFLSVSLFKLSVIGTVSVVVVVDSLVFVSPVKANTGLDTKFPNVIKDKIKYLYLYFTFSLPLLQLTIN